MTYASVGDEGTEEGGETWRRSRIYNIDVRDNNKSRKPPDDDNEEVTKKKKLSRWRQ